MQPTARTVLAAAGASDDRGTGVVGMPVTVTPLGNDHASGGAHFDDPTLQLIDPATGKAANSVTVPGQGTWTVGAGGTVTFSPVSGFGGTASIDYRATDSDGQTVTATITVTYPDALLTKGVLAFTGSTGSGWLAAGAMAAILAGLVLVILRRRPGTR